MPEVNFTEPVFLGEGKVWITGSKTRSGLHHTTICTTDGKWNCTCEAWRFRYNCRHVNELKDELGDDDDVQVSLG